MSAAGWWHQGPTTPAKSQHGATVRESRGALAAITFSATVVTIFLTYDRVMRFTRLTVAGTACAVDGALALAGRARPAMTVS